MPHDIEDAYKITLTSRVRAKPTVYGTSVNDELVLFDPESGAYYGAGVVGRTIWDLIKHDRDVKSVCEQVLEQFDVDEETCEAEALMFLCELQSKGLVEVDPKLD